MIECEDRPDMIRPIRSLQDSSIDTLGYFRDSPADVVSVRCHADGA